MSAAVAHLADARFGYHGQVAVHADLQVGAGEVVAVLGANGSGKSTLVKGMLGLVDAHGGDTRWFGRPLGALRERWRIGYVPQRQLASAPIPVTLDELVRSGRVARAGLLGRYGAADRRAVDAAIEAVGLADRRRTPVRELSGGQQRRAVVARALAGDAEVLVLDEPFAGVDRDSQRALAGTFTTLAERGVTLIVVLHELGPLAALITRTVHMAGGEVVYDGAPDARPPELMAHGDDDLHGGHHHGSRDHSHAGAKARLGLLGR